MLKKYNQWLIVALIALIVLSLVGCGGQGANTSGNDRTQKIVIRLSHALPENHYISAQMRAWAELVMKKSKEQVDVQLYPTGQLYKDADLIEAVQTGAIEAGHAYDFTLAKSIPEARVFAAPFLFEGKVTEITQKVLTSPIRSRLEADMEKQGMKGILFLPWSMEEGGVIASKQVKTSTDAKGLTLRATSPDTAAIYQQWGSNVSYLNGSEVYTGLQRGVIQGSEGTLTTSVERKLYEVAPNFTILPYSARVSMIVMNKKFYDKLPPEIQKAISEATKEIEEKTVAAAKTNLEAVLKTSVEKGIKIYTPTPEELKQFEGDRDKLWQSLYKDYPQILADIKEIQKIEAQLKQ
ncbi:MAG: TRAP transporter substrate-binding protein [Desulfitobacteriaceae bacterium]